jgi:hypothetical protein
VRRCVKSLVVVLALGLVSDLAAQFRPAIKEIDAVSSGPSHGGVLPSGEDQKATLSQNGPSVPAPSGDSGAQSKPSLPSELWHRLEFHGTLSQGFIYGSGNNYLSMETDNGSAKWTEATINGRAAIRDNFHVGLQLHSYFMGQLGRGTIQADWAFADYRLKQWLGLRGGKLKAPLGLFGEIEDTDTLYNWALLPQSIYESEFRSYNVPVIGGELYGNLRHGRNSISWELFGGRRNVAGNDGVALLAAQLYTIQMGSDAGYTYGGDVTWEMPIKGLTARVFLDRSRVVSPHAYWPVNPYHVPMFLKIDSTVRREIYSLRFQRGKLDLAAEGKHEPHWVANNNVPVLPSGSPRNAWYAMGAYRVTQKLTLGSYFSRVWGTSFVETFRWADYDPSKPEFYSQDTVANARYDINRFVYLKLEGHYMDGYLGAFFPATNPNGLQKVTRLEIVRLGFTF